MPFIRSCARQAGRDTRLDVFRGYALIVIFAAHVPFNALAVLSPSNFGFSDATEIFVFCSGIAAALAYGSTFDRHGALAGTMRVALRCWHLYWMHVCVLLSALVLLILADAWLPGGGHYVSESPLAPLLGADAARHIVAAMTLGFLPSLFNILPMYIAILAFVPLVMAVSRLGRSAVAIVVLALWLLGTTGTVSFHAEPGGHDTWFFNPLAWQLVFFIGFAFARGWLPAPRRDWRVAVVAAVVLVALAPLAFPPAVDHSALLRVGNEALWPLVDKTHFRPLRLLHFLSLAYLVYFASGEGGRNVKGALAGVLALLGRQALAVFAAGILLSLATGLLLDVVGRAPTLVVLANALSILTLFAVAATSEAFKNAPWTVRAAAKTSVPSVPLATAAATPSETGDRGLSEAIVLRAEANPAAV